MKVPNNPIAEKSLLACLLMDNDIAIEVVPKLAVDDFYLLEHQTIFAAIKDIQSSGSTVDLANITDKLTANDSLGRAGGIKNLTSISVYLPSAAHYNEYLAIIKRQSTLRKLIKSSAEIIEIASTSDDENRALAIAEKKIFDISQNRHTGGLEHISTAFSDAVATIQRKGNGCYKGIMTGIKEFDKRTSGFHKGNLIILAATTGVGKSALAINITEHAARNGNTVAFFSLEMPAREIAQRLISSVSMVTMTELNRGLKKDENKWRRVWDCGDFFNDKHIYIDDSSLNTPAEIRSKCLRLKATNKLDFVVIDYLQLMTLNDKKTTQRYLEIAEITRNLKIIAKELDVPILALSQLSREAAKRNVKEGKEPVLSDLRESGSIEQDADMVMFIHKKSEYEQYNSDEITDVDLIVAKNRNGATFRLPLMWIGENVRFAEKEVENGKLHEERHIVVSDVDTLEF